mmetsp:Transcript_12757/g.53469  ORF Transcript_12757/g.53469 Transcript_12757/m.53469 type:complete len:223 (+) Transcript_12757:1429-2097(+)
MPSPAAVSRWIGPWRPWASRRRERRRPATRTGCPRRQARRTGLPKAARGSRRARRPSEARRKSRSREARRAWRRERSRWESPASAWLWLRGQKDPRTRPASLLRTRLPRSRRRARSARWRSHPASSSSWTPPSWKRGRSSRSHRTGCRARSSRSSSAACLEKACAGKRHDLEATSRVTRAALAGNELHRPQGRLPDARVAPDPVSGAPDALTVVTHARAASS